jgi:mRNA interferase MazF
MKRSDVATVAGRGDFPRKPRPTEIVQSGLLRTLDSVTVCPLTSMDGLAVTRVRVEPTPEPPVRVPWVAVNKIATVRRHRIASGLEA